MNGKCFSKVNDVRQPQAVRPQTNERVQELSQQEMLQLEGGTVQPSTQFPNKNQKWNNYLFFGFHQAVDIDAAG